MSVAPIQTFFVPLPQEQLYDSLSDISNEVQGSMVVGIGIAVAAPGTVIYYDHWEDGYEVDVTQPAQSSTEIWGDGDLTNGVAPGTVDDLLSGGDLLELINTIPANRTDSQIFFDGSDRIQASFPIAVTTGSFVEHPGSFLAGASEVFDTDSWGSSYTIPVGEDTDDDSGTDPFEYTAVYVMAGSDDTIVTIDGPNGTTVTLDRGENVVVRVNQGNTVTASKPVQAQLITGDVNEQYEMRWYALTPTDQWSNEYYSPVAEETGSTGFWFYNPNGSDITINYEGNGFGDATDFLSVGAGEVAFIEVDNGGDIDIPGGTSTGLRFYSESGETFFAISQIDADDRGATFDWGTRLLTPNELSPQVLVGLGYGNSANDPQVSSRSVVWVMPVAAAYIHIDFDGDGTADYSTPSALAALETIRIIDDSTQFPGAEDDQDMSGATIWATQGEEPDSDPVDIAAAWGQDPSLSGDGDTYALDLGTLIPPLPGLTAAKSVVDVDGDGKFDPGDILEYTITVLNFTRVVVNAGGYSIIDDFSPLFVNADYLPGTTTYSYVLDGDEGPDGQFGTIDDTVTPSAVLDNDTGGGATAFPLDDDVANDGLLSTDAISGYERQTYTFRVQIKPFDQLTPEIDPVTGTGTVEIVNTAHLLESGVPIKDLEVDIPLEFEAGIQLVKYTNGFDPVDFAEFVQNLILVVGTDTATWKYDITNTGGTSLATVTLVDDNGTPDGDDDFVHVFTDTELEAIGDGDNVFDPGEMLLFERPPEPVVEGFYRNVATVTGDPVFADGTTPVAGLPQVTDDDPSAYLGIPEGGVVQLDFDKQAVAVNGVQGAPVTHAGDVITYEITVINSGTVPIPLINVQDPLLNAPGGSLGNPVQTGPGDNANALLDAGETWTWTGTYTVQQSDLDSLATNEPDDVAPDMIDNTATLYLGDDIVIDTGSAQVPVVYECDLAAVKTVVDVGGKGPDGAIDGPGEAITYQIAVTNNGSLSLTGVSIDDPLLEGPNGTLGAPVESMNANGVLEVGETWTYTGTYTVDAATYFAISGRNKFENCFIRNAASFESDQGCSATTNETKTRLFSGDIICGTRGKDVIDGTAKGEFAPTEGGDIILGIKGNDVIDGMGGNDWLNGGRGNDKLAGGSGNDSLVFNTGLKKRNADKLVDFKAGEDTIVLDSSIFKKLDPGALDPKFFAYNKAKDNNDFVVFDKENKTLIYDKNGSKNGGEKLFAKLKGDVGDIGADDFFVV
jgi:uncharacterized repeat protein (TIGR01451 family)